MNLAIGLRLPGLRALAGLATIALTSACTYDFDQFEGLAPPTTDDAGQSGRGGSGGAGKDASAPDGTAGRGGTGATAGTGPGGSGGGGSGGATGSGGSGAAAGSGGSGGSGGTTGGTAGKGGTSGAGGSSGGGGSGGQVADASIDGSGGASASGGAAGSGGGTSGGSGGATAGSGGVGGSGGATAGSGGASGGSGGTGGGTAGSSGASIADASDVNRPPDAPPDRGPDVTPDATFDCASVNGTVYQGHCYYARSVAVDWNTANTTTCEAPAHLVTITSAGEQQVVAGLLTAQDRWIGLRRPTNSPKAESSFYWVTNEAISYRAWDIYSDADKEPNYTGECVRMRFTDLWADVACTEALAVVCERE